MTGGFQLAGWHQTSFTGTLVSFLTIFSFITIVRQFYAHSHMEEVLPESSLLILIGLLAGFVFVLIPTADAAVVQDALTFSSDIFLLIFLPIIIFDAAYFMDKYVFFHNIVDILTLAVFGTLISTFSIGGLLLAVKSTYYAHVPFEFTHLFTFGALISAIDPVSVMAVMQQMHVNTNLYNLGFGESTLNDGVSIVLFQLFSSLQSLVDENKTVGEIVGLGIAKFFVSVFGAFGVAAVVSFIFCWLTKHSHKLPNVEPLLLILCAMFSYILAEMMKFSGVMAVMLCALILDRYSAFNLHQDSSHTFKGLIRLLAQTFESCLFLDMGFQIAFIASENTKLNYLFIVFTIIFCVVMRFIIVVILTSLLNIRRKKMGEMIPFKEMIILTWGGLRGSVSFALAGSVATGDTLLDKQIVFSTCIVVLFTIIVFGLTMKSMIACMKIKKEPDKKSQDEWSNQDAGQQLAKEVLFKPFKNINKIMVAVGAGTGKAKFSLFLMSIDQWLQKQFLRELLPEEQNLIEILNFVRQNQISGRMDVQDRILNNQIREQLERQMIQDNPRLQFENAIPVSKPSIPQTRLRVETNQSAEQQDKVQELFNLIDQKAAQEIQEKQIQRQQEKQARKAERGIGGLKNRSKVMMGDFAQQGSIV